MQLYYSNRPHNAFTIPEAMVALSIVAVALAAVMLANSHQLRMVKSDRDTVAATLCLQERAEQLRIANWIKVTNPDYVADTLFATRPLSAAPLDRIVERLTIRDYNPDPDAAPRVQMVVEKESGSAPRIKHRGPGLQNERLARVDLLVSWQRKGGGERTRSTSTVVSNVGTSRLGLPGFGGTDGVPSGPPPITDVPVIQPVDPTVVVPPPVVVPPTGNGNGNGNVHGGKGKDV